MNMRCLPFYKPRWVTGIQAEWGTRVSSLHKVILLHVLVLLKGKEFYMQ